MNANLFKWNMMCTFVIAGVVHLNAQPGFFLFIFFFCERENGCERLIGNLRDVVVFVVVDNNDNGMQPEMINLLLIQWPLDTMISVPSEMGSEVVR